MYHFLLVKNTFENSDKPELQIYYAVLRCEMVWLENLIEFLIESFISKQTVEWLYVFGVSLLCTIFMYPYKICHIYTENVHLCTLGIGYSMVVYLVFIGSCPYFIILY